MSLSAACKHVERYHGDNLISRLPDEILLVILSFIPLKEAGRTSVLSSRWRNLWSYTSHLNFEDHSSLEKMIQERNCWTVGVSVEMEKYVKWVDSVLQSHRGSTMKELRICFNLVRSARKSITKWLEFAFERHTEKLELDLSYGGFNHDPFDQYVFPQELCEYISSDCRYKSSRLFNCKSIQMLCLGGIDVSGEIIEFFVCGCPLLEQLVVYASYILTRLEVCGPSLKHLEIRMCIYLESLRISAPKLTSLIIDKQEGLLLEDVPMLTNVNITLMDPWIPLIPILRCCLSHLEILELDILMSKELLSTLKFPVMPKLKKLVIMKKLHGVDSSLLGLAHFISASPNLREFEIKQSWLKAERSNNEIQKGLKHFPLHQHLNVFRFLGYYGCPSDFELVNYLLENCVALKEIIVDPQTQPIWVACDPLDSEIAKGNAKQQLEPLVPDHISLFIC